MGKQYDQPLRLTTPAMTGQKVKDAQWLMAGHNRFEGLATMKDAQIDGVYGLVTAQAVKRTKYWLGYPLASCDMVFGQTIYEYLRPNQWRPLPTLFRQRRAARLKAAQKTVGDKALDLAITQLGTEEYPFGSNRQKYGAWYGWNGVAWCAIFESWCLHFTGWTRFRYAACALIYYDARMGRNGMRQVWTPRRGDVVIYNVRGDRFGHTSFFEKWIDHDTFQEVGGNTGSRGFNNGGEVARGQRNTSQVTAYIRVG